MTKQEFYIDEAGCHSLCDTEDEARILATKTGGEALGQTVFIEASDIAALEIKGYPVT